MLSVCLIFWIHLPHLLRHYTFFDIRNNHDYEDEEKMRDFVNRTAEEYYRPANELIQGLIRQLGDDFRVAFLLTGILLDHCDKHRKDLLESFQKLIQTGCIEVLGDTYYHSLAFLFSPREFRDQVLLHREKVAALFGKRTETFCHTELIYNNNLAKNLEKMGFTSVLVNGSKRALGNRSTYHVYRPKECKKLKILLCNATLDNLTFRFGDHTWSEHLQSTEKCTSVLHHIGKNAEVITFCIRYETLGKYLREGTEISDFFYILPQELVKNGKFRFLTPADIAREYEPVGQLDVPEFISWTGTGENSPSCLVDNALQKDALRTLYSLEPKVRRCNNRELLTTWRRLQSCDHFISMRTEPLAEETTHHSGMLHLSPYDAYIDYMNILDDFSHLLGKKGVKKTDEKPS